MRELHPDFKEFLASLSGCRVEYLLIGGYAVSAHGFNRYTGDIDVWINPTADNAARVAAALRVFGFWAPDFSEEKFQDETWMAHIGREPVRIEILTAVSGLTFPEAASNAEVMTFDGLSVPVISLRDLRTNKAASGRPKDLADLDNLPTPSEPDEADSGP